MANEYEEALFDRLILENKRLKSLVRGLELEIEKAVLLSREIHELEEK